MTGTEHTKARNACEEARQKLMDMEVPLSELRALLNVLSMSADQMCDSPTTEFQGNGLNSLYTVLDSRAERVWQLWSDAWDATAKPDGEPASTQEGGGLLQEVQGAVDSNAAAARKENSDV